MFPETMPRDLQTSLSSKSAGELLLFLKLKKDVRVMSTTILWLMVSLEQFITLVLLTNQ